MPLSEQARRRLAGLWGAYDFRIIRDKHFATASDLAENFLEYHGNKWKESQDRVDCELLKRADEVRNLIYVWANKKLQTKMGDSLTVLKTHIMFKYLYFGRNDRTIHFGSKGMDWKSKAEIEKELSLYRPWSIDHVMAVFGKRNFFGRMAATVKRSNSPTEDRFFENWVKLSDETDRPMLFPQVSGHTSGRFWQEISKDKVRPMHFDFGLVNVVKRKKILIECDSRRYHSKDRQYQLDRDRQNYALEYGWTMLRFTYEDVMKHWEEKCLPYLIDNCFY